MKEPDEEHQCPPMQVALYARRLEKQARISRFGLAWYFECSPVENPAFDADIFSVPIIFCPFCRSNLAMVSVRWRP